jgi:hypothetical protein
MTQPLCRECYLQNNISYPHGLSDHPQEHSDLLGFCVDVGMRELTEALYVGGFVTYTTCVGMCDFCDERPYVGFADVETAVSVVGLAKTDERKRIDASPQDRDKILRTHEWVIRADAFPVPDDLSKVRPMVVLALPARDLAWLSELVRASSYREARQNVIMTPRVYEAPIWAKPGTSSPRPTRDTPTSWLSGCPPPPPCD